MRNSFNMVYHWSMHDGDIILSHEDKSLQKHAQKFMADGLRKAVEIIATNHLVVAQLAEFIAEQEIMAADAIDEFLQPYNDLRPVLEARGGEAEHDGTDEQPADA